MPRVPRLPPATRMYARLDRFACECPSCGQLIESAYEPVKAQRLAKLSRRRQVAAGEPTSRSVRKLRWNPALQRLRCPHCGVVYMVGLLLFQVASNAYGRLVAPSDVRMTPADRRLVRARGGGWLVAQKYHAGDPVNLVVEDPCSCPVKGWDRRCAVHGEPPAEGGER